MIIGIGIGLLGSILQIDVPQIEKVLPVTVSRFILGFILTYFSFPMRRIVVMGIFSNILGPSRQGTWMGVMIAAGMMARSLALFTAWQAMEVVNRNLAMGICGCPLASVIFL